MSDLQMSGDAVRGLAASLREGSERAARAGVALAGLETGLSAPAAGLRLTTALAGLSVGWSGVLDDLVAGLAQLAAWTDDAATVTVAADTAAEQSFHGIPR